MAVSASFRPRNLSERIDYWISIKNWPWMVRMHRLIYRLSGGRLAGKKRGIPVLLLTTTGRRTGRAQTAPLMYLADGSRYVLVGSNAGLDRDPGWCFNIRENPDATIQVGSDLIRVAAREATEAERDELWPRVVALNPFYEGFQKRTFRKTPLMILEPSTPRMAGDSDVKNERRGGE